MSEVVLDQVTAVIKDEVRLEGITLAMRKGEQWGIVGANGSGKSALGKLLCGRLPVASGSCRLPARTGYVSFERVNEILEIERYNDDSDFLDYIDEGTLARDFILEGEPTGERKLRDLARLLNFTGILDRGIKYLSTGEMRKIVVCKALMQDPELLILDEPFDGLDVASCAALKMLISGCVDSGIRVVLLLNRFSELVPEITHVGYIKNRRLIMTGPKEELLASEALRRLHAFHYTLPAELPEVDAATVNPPLPAGQPLIEMKAVKVSYGEKAILSGLTWTVKPGEHWKISGPNGAGKSTLLAMVSGDHPQAYANDITLFGIRKGSGESVWDIKKRIGLVSTALQQDYRVGVTVRVAVISGFFDSIGVYGDYTKKQQEIALDWLRMLHLEELAEAPFRNLSYGEQRLVLLARAMVKQPDLLILDEPCQGLDDVNREMVLKLIDHLGSAGKTQLLYVTHHAEDDIPCIANHLELVPAKEAGFTGKVS
ncbi:molybdate ABC transporter ATP-binding protein ModF [Geomonas sp. Red32]|uniref:molybdate ABC transporter ATP-binding protein ModF n=1 Tax=Geomonas sp. Red32 TaxID=2912856 RepID=UPI00202CCA18|nr:molybdate ABC transporter ATP-binding protein ModF [Geomonas sp. Red32]MCM0083009.1 molybdate ABC transporter ATP-binding protein ModF [Geomonas sp. Red32]